MTQGDDEIIIDYTIPDDVDSLSQQMETTTGDNMDYAQLTSAVTTSTTLGIQGMTEDMDYEYTTLVLLKKGFTLFSEIQNSETQYSEVSKQ
uniref:Uncharacterized protein n=1 Tax=Romanomermis culicivorax TaxID=13658 RepID=A0A915KYL8_ROMCU